MMRSHVGREKKVIYRILLPNKDRNQIGIQLPKRYIGTEHSMFTKHRDY